MRALEHDRTLTLLVVTIAMASAGAAGLGIFSGGGPGPSQHVSVRGLAVTLYGWGLYRHMSMEVAPQGIAQDYVTLFLAIPLLVAALAWARRGSLRGRFLLAGVLGYFLVTYLFYLMMGTYNEMFLGYVVLLSSSFFALAIVLLGFERERLPMRFADSAALRAGGIYLVVSAILIGVLWLGIVVPPLLNRTVIPVQVEHYTTLVVQGLDLALLLPLSCLSGALLLRRRPLGYLLAPIYLVFLSLLMTALSAKVAAMGLLGFSIIPVVFIIPTLNVMAIALTVLVLSRIRKAGDGFAPSA